MADPEVKPGVHLVNSVPVAEINAIAATKAGQVVLRWLAVRCFDRRCTIVGNPETHEINPLGSVAQAYVQRLYQDIWRAIKPELRINIDYPNQNEK